MFVKIIKSLVFFPMLWLRRLFKIICKIISLVGFLMGLLNFESVGKLHKDWTACILFLTISFVTFLIYFFYDSILLKLNPTDTEPSLER